MLEEKPTNRKHSTTFFFKEYVLGHPSRKIWERLHLGVQRSGDLSEPKRRHVELRVLRPSRIDKGLADRQEDSTVPRLSGLC